MAYIKHFLLGSMNSLNSARSGFLHTGWPGAFGSKEVDIDALEKSFQKLLGKSFTFPFGSFFYNAKPASRSIIYAFLTVIMLAEGLYMAVAVQNLVRNETFNLPSSPIHAVAVIAPKKIILVDNGISTEHISFAKTPKDFFQNKNIFIGENDLVIPQENSLLQGFSVKITIHRAKSVTIVDNNYKFEVLGIFDTVGDIFKESAIYTNILIERGIDLSKKVKDGSEVVLDTKITQRGIASWYGPGFDGRLTASGEVYDMHGISAAHKTLPLGTIVRVVNVRNGKWVVLNINDRGPYIGARMLDLSLGAKRELEAGDLSYVWVEVLKYPEKFVYGTDTSLEGEER